MRKLSALGCLELALLIFQTVILVMCAFRNSEGGGVTTPYVITVITQPKISGPAVITQPKRHPEPGARP